jgi:hypothetical protein
MRHARKMGRPSAVLAAFIAALSLPAIASAAAARHALVTEVHVTVTDTAILVKPADLEPGPATIFVANKGATVHVLTISGPGVQGMKAQVAPGKIATLRMKLLTGSYRLSDPLKLGASKMRWLVVRPSNIVGARAVTPTKQAPTNAIVPGGMDCDL